MIKFFKKLFASSTLYDLSDEFIKNQSIEDLLKLLASAQSISLSTGNRTVREILTRFYRKLGE
jgi:hypothetical protein